MSACVIGGLGRLGSLFTTLTSALSLTTSFSRSRAAHLLGNQKRLDQVGIAFRMLVLHPVVGRLVTLETVSHQQVTQDSRRLGWLRSRPNQKHFLAVSLRACVRMCRYLFCVFCAESRFRDPRGEASGRRI